MKFLLLGNFVVPIKNLFFIVFKLHQIIIYISSFQMLASYTTHPPSKDSRFHKSIDKVPDFCLQQIQIPDIYLITLSSNGTQNNQIDILNGPRYKIKLIIQMNFGKFNSQTLMREFISQAHIQNPKERTSLKQKFHKKLSHHINMIEYHRLREDRFILSQQKIIEKQNNSIERAKEFINFKQEKASSLKNYKLVERSKRAEEDLTRWEFIVSKNKDNYKKQINQSEIVIKNWQNKLSESCERKSLILDDVSKNLKQKSTQKHKKIQNLRTYLDKLNPEGKLKQIRAKKKSKQTNTTVKQRVVTETISQKRRKQQQKEMNSSLIKIVNKEQRINQARYTRHFLHQKKKKQLVEKAKMMQAIRDHHLNSLRNHEQEKHQEYDKRYKIERVKSNSLISKSKEKLPHLQDMSHSNSQQKKVKIKDSASLRIFNSFGEQHNSIQYSHNVSPNRNYQKLMTEKLKDISMIMRLNRNIRKVQ